MNRVDPHEERFVLTYEKNPAYAGRERVYRQSVMSFALKDETLAREAEAETKADPRFTNVRLRRLTRAEWGRREQLGILWGPRP